ncbi:ABC transporter ATP-binding protein [Anaerolentibacter hominis]|uniref:ABC transporter ATP-binding protein n=1 Tax=Anaerolentibacter hominis TaxID=3079009 RepID=UPI0031B897C9
MEEDRIIIQHVSKYYGKKQVLYDLNLTIEKGMFGLLGRNGAGKSTLMKLLASLLNKQEGKITVCGVPIEHSGEVRRIIGYLPQDFNVYPSMRAEEAMDYLGVLSGLSRSCRRKRTDELLERVNLQNERRKKVKSLSGGMRQRLGIAQALLNDPKVLIVDEPTAGLDPEERIRFRNLLCEVAKERIVLLSTHIVGDIEAACDKIAILNEGHLLYDGTVEKLKQKVEGKIYRTEVVTAEADKIRTEYIVTGMVRKGEMCSVRFLSDRPGLPGAAACIPNVEDAYMYCLASSGPSGGMTGGEVK